MQSTPDSSRVQIALFGATNAGKSSLFNALGGSELALVSPVSGTTTDTVKKAMEWVGFGPVVLIDTAGLGDTGALGEARLRLSRKVLERCDLILYLFDGAAGPDERRAELERYARFLAGLPKARTIPHLCVVNKAEGLGEAQRAEWLEHLPRALFVSAKDEAGVARLREAAIAELRRGRSEEPGLLDGLLSRGDTLLLVVPIDSEAPKGRLILPQAQLIRAALDRGLRCLITDETQLAETLAEAPQVKLAVCDSQVFKEVAAQIPPALPLTSFSMLFARQKADFAQLLAGLRRAYTLRAGERVLIAEACSHSKSHEDIGSVKIPRALEALSGQKLRFDFCAARDFPEQLEDYALAVHCGACMITANELRQRMALAAERALPMTNYGLVLAAQAGILERSLAPFGLQP